MQIRHVRNAWLLWGGCVLAAFFLQAEAHCAVAGDFNMRLVASDPLGGGDAAISPDGQRFITSSKRSGNWDLWAYELSSGQWTQLTDHPADDLEGRWSPDGKSVVFTSTRCGSMDIWLLSTEDGTLRQLSTAPLNEEYPSWSPDGRSVVYTGGPWTARNFFITEVASGETRQVNRQPIPAGGACSFDPDGDSLVCHTYDQGSGRLGRRTIAEDRVVMLTEGESWDYKPMVSPDGRWTTFSRSQERPADIWMRSNSSGREQPLAQSATEDRWPGWDATGDRLFFHRVVDMGRSLMVLDRSSGEVRRLEGVKEARPLQASFDPAAQRVVYCFEGEGRSLLGILDLASGTDEYLETGLGQACYPSWSPKGDWIAFAHQELGKRWEINVIRPEGGGRVSLTQGVPGLRGLDGPLGWSPDGSQIVFHGDTGAFEADLYLVDVETHKVRNLTQDSWFDESPSWTPDGEGVVFMSTRGGDWTWGLFQLSLASGEIETLVEPDYVEKNDPHLGADGTLMWSMVDDQGIQTVAQRAASGELQVLDEVGHGARWPSTSADGRFVLFTETEHWVEFWLIEFPFGHGSPWVDEERQAKVSDLEPSMPLSDHRSRNRKTSLRPELGRRVPSIPVGEVAGVPGPGGAPSRSPVDLFHR